MRTLALLVLVGCCGAPTAQACAIEDCPGLPSACYNLEGPRWCARTAGYNAPFSGWYTVRVVDHTRYSAVTAKAIQAWDYPPVKPGNSLYLLMVAAGQPHEVDIWEATSSDWWWGYTHYNAGSGCMTSAYISLNLTHFPMDPTWQLWVLTHELGHAVGLGHVCGCGGGRVMNPCTECSTPATLSSCDAQGAAALYH